MSARRDEVAASADPVDLPYSRLRKVGPLLLMSGQVPLDSRGELVSEQFEGQFHYVMNSIHEILISNGADMSNVVQMRCFLSRSSDFVLFNQLCEAFLERPYPTRTTVITKMPVEGILIEIEPTAAIFSERFQEFVEKGR